MHHLILQPAFIWGLGIGIILMFVVSQLAIWKNFLGEVHSKPTERGSMLPYTYGPSTYEPSGLGKENADLKIKCQQQETRIRELQVATPPQLEIITYQQAADWLRMINTITWTMSSIYLAAAFIALNGALSEYLVDTAWRRIIGAAVCLLSLIWFLVDNVYSSSARDARLKLKALENTWNMRHVTFFKGQDTQQDARQVLSGCLRISMIVPLVLGLIVALEPQLDLGVFTK